VAAIDRGASVERGMSRLSQFPSPQDLLSLLRLASDIPNEVTVSPSTLLERSRRVGQDVCTAKQFLLVESIGFYAACAIDWDAGAFMSIGQAILFGMMLYWTPSVVLLAWLIWKERIGVKEV
jgi:hypothetical protein